MTTRFSGDRAEKIGATGGLVTDCGAGCPEQVYVFRDDDARRPVVIEGWVGYGPDSRMRLTQRQAMELIPLLTEAVLRGASA